MPGEAAWRVRTAEEVWGAFDPGEDGERYGVGTARDDVIRAADLRAGQWVLDLGAGPGLIAIEARRRVGMTGRVIALDLVHGGLDRCRQRAGREEGAPLWPVRGNALRLPFGQDRFDAVTARSVLMYVENRTAAVREIHRVLRPGGWISTFDPVFGQSRRWQWWLAMDMTPFQPAHGRILRYRQEHEPLWNAIYGFTTADLVRCFWETGFRVVNTRVDERSYTGMVLPERTPAAYVDASHFMGPTYAEAARAVLGADADAYLARLARQPLTLPQTTGGVDLFVCARK